MPVAFNRGAPAVEKANLSHRAQAAAPFAGPTAVFSQLVAQHAQRQVRLDILDRVVARVRIQRVHRVHAVDPTAAAVTAFENLHVDPVTVIAQARERDHLQIADPGRNLPRHRLRQRLHNGVGELVARAETRNRRRRKDRIRQTSLGAMIRIGRVRPSFTGT